MAPWLSPLLKLWAHLRVRAIISPAQALGHLRLGEGTEHLLAPSLSPGPDAQPATPSPLPWARPLSSTRALLRATRDEAGVSRSRGGVMQMGDKARRAILGVLYRNEFLQRIEGCYLRKPEQERKHQRGKTLRYCYPPISLRRVMKLESRGPGFQLSGLSPSCLNTTPTSLPPFLALGHGCWAQAG